MSADNVFGELDWISQCMVHTPSGSPSKSQAQPAIHLSPARKDASSYKAPSVHGNVPWDSLSTFSPVHRSLQAHIPRSPLLRLFPHSPRSLSSLFRSDSGSSGSSYPSLSSQFNANTPGSKNPSHLEMIASPPLLTALPRSSPSRFPFSPPKLSDHLTSSDSPNFFSTPPAFFAPSFTPGISPIEHSPKPPRPRAPVHSKDLVSEADDFFYDAIDDDDSSGIATPLLDRLLRARSNLSESSSPAPVSPALAAAPLASLRATPSSKSASSPGRLVESTFNSPLSAVSRSAVSSPRLSDASNASVDAASTLPARARRALDKSPRCDTSSPPVHERAGSNRVPKRPSSDIQPVAKRRKTDSAANSTPEATNSLTISSQRTLPAAIETDSSFSLFYRRFPVSSYFQTGEDPPVLKSKGKLVGATYNPPRDALDLYTPRFVRGSGREKVGVCPICCESAARGGEDKVLWLSMKFSAFKCYHMQYYHGISASTGLPFSPPTAFRIVPHTNAGKLEKTEIKQGRCHKCKKWVAVEGVKNVDAKVKEIFWWKHAATCHHGSRLRGEDGFYLEDDTFHKLAPASDT